MFHKEYHMLPELFTNLKLNAYEYTRCECRNAGTSVLHNVSTKRASLKKPQVNHYNNELLLTLIRSHGRMKTSTVNIFTHGNSVLVVYCDQACLK